MMEQRKIIGVGTDIVNTARIEKLLKKYGERFINKNFHELEVLCFRSLPEHRKVSYLVKRFAAKEAVAKAFGFGIGKNISFCDIAITNNDLGAPKVQIDKKKMPNIGEYDIHISLSDDQSFAVAFVVISK